MNKLLLLIFSIITLAAQGQTSVYHPFPDSNATWCSSYNYEISGPYCYIGNAIDRLYGKSIIKGITYNNLIRFEYIRSTAIGCSNYIYENKHTSTSYIRQDTVLKKVWVYDSIAQKDTIFYDFDLHIGDTLNRAKVAWDHAGWPEQVVSSIDSVLLVGSYRKRFNFQPGYGSIYPDTSLIEGIGSLTGLTIAPTYGTYYCTLDKFIQDNQALVGDTSAISCPYVISNVSEILDKQILIVSPNPLISSSILQLYPIVKNAEVVIYNVLGKEMERKRMNGDRMVIERGSLENGVYFVRVQTGQRNYVRKLIVQ